MADALSPETIATIKATAPALQQHGLAITNRMHERLLVDADVEAVLDEAAQDSGEQPRRRAAAIVASAQNVDRLDPLGDAVERMVLRHVEIGVQPEHHPKVASALLPAIEDVLGAAVDEPTLTAWGRVYGVLADVLIGQEAALAARAG